MTIIFAKDDAVTYSRWLYDNLVYYVVALTCTACLLAEYPVASGAPTKPTTLLTVAMVPLP